MPPPDKLHALRELLARRFPQTAPSGHARCLGTGIPAVDEATGGLPIGAITEAACTAASSGGSLFLSRVLASCRAQHLRVALIDGGDHFDPRSLTPDETAHVVWVRCRDLKQVMQSADLLARDANFGLVVIDVRSSTLDRDLRKEPPTSWYRLQRAAEQTDLPLLVTTARILVPSAQVRFVLDRSLSIGALDEPRLALTETLSPTLQRQRLIAASM